METIKNYLDNMFAGLPRTPETERAKRELLNMMEDKYNELLAEGKTENEAVGRVISEFGNLNELKEELGLTDADMTSNTPRRTVCFEEAQEYLSASAKSAKRIGLGVSLCILSPVMIILLSGTSVFDIPGANAKLAVFFGLAFLFAFVAVAVALFITTGLSMSKFNYLKSEELYLDGSTLSFLKQAQEKFKQSFALLVTIGVVICIISVVPLLGIAILITEEGDLAVVGVAIMLAFLSAGVFMFINAGMVKDSYSVLLQEGEYSNKKVNTLLENISKVYWSVVVAVYLIWSFTTFNWGTTWIVWPVAGVLFGVVSAVVNAIDRKAR